VLAISAPTIFVNGQLQLNLLSKMWSHVFGTQCTLCLQKTKQDNFSIILSPFRADKILYNLEDLFLSLLRTQLQLTAFPTKRV